MGAPAIQAEGLGKRYRLGRPEERHNTLRDSLAAGARRLGRSLSGRGPAAGGGRWGPEFWALRGVGFEVAQGEVLGIVGSNGAGKSTLLKVLARITEPTEGRAVLRGRVGSLLEVGTGFHSELTGRENIYLSGAILGMRRAEIRRKFDEIVAFAEVEPFIDTPVKRYSSGMYLRLAFAVAAHLEPEILFVDEVLAVGDARFQRKCMGKMQDASAREGRTVLFVSHNMNAVQRLCDRCLLLQSGELVAAGPTVEVVARYLATSVTAGAPSRWIDLSRVPRAGSGAARFAALQYRSPSAAAGFQPYPGGALELRLAIASDAPRTVGNLALTFYDLGGTKLVNADSLALGRGLALGAGQNLLRLRIEELHLNPGVYALGFWLTERGGGLLDFSESALEIEVVEREGRGFGARPAGDGVVPCRFTLELEEG